MTTHGSHKPGMVCLECQRAPMTPRAFLAEQVERIEANAAARERNRIRALIDPIPADGWGARRFKSHVLAALWPVTAVEPSGERKGGAEAADTRPGDSTAAGNDTAPAVAASDSKAEPIPPGSGPPTVRRLDQPRPTLNGGHAPESVGQVGT